MSCGMNESFGSQAMTESTSKYFAVGERLGSSRRDEASSYEIEMEEERRLALYSSWIHRTPFPPKDAHQAAWNGHNWHKQPSSFSWQHAAHGFPLPSFFDSKSAQRTELQFMRYVSNGYQFCECHAINYQTTDCHATKCRGISYETDNYRVFGCHATDYQTISSHEVCKASGYRGSRSPAVEHKALGNQLKVGALAYDHGRFPKIISVHSITENPLQKSSTKCASGLDFTLVESNLDGPTPTPALTTEASKFHSGSLTAAEKLFKDEHKLSNNHHGGDEITSSKFIDKASEDNEVQCNDPVTAMLSLNATKIDFSEPCLVQDECRDETSTDALGNEMRNTGCLHDDEQNAKERKGTNGDDKQIFSTGLKSSNVTNSPPKFGNQKATKTSTTEAQELSVKNTRERLVKKKKTALILQRVQKFRAIQLILKESKVSKPQRLRLAKKMAILRKEVEYLSNGIPIDQFGKEQGSLFNATAVKTSLIAPNKGMKQGTEVGKQESQVEKSSLKTHCSSMENSFSPEKASGNVTENDKPLYRMNIFEKMELLLEKNTDSFSTEVSGIAGESFKKTQTSLGTKRQENFLEVDFRKKEEQLASQFKMVKSEDAGEYEGSGKFSVKSQHCTNARETTDGTLPNNWSFAYVSDNPKYPLVLKDRNNSLKRKQTEVNVLCDEPAAKRRCKTLPRKLAAKSTTNHLERAIHSDCVKLSEASFHERKSGEFAQVPKHLPKATELESSKTGSSQTGSSESHDQTVLSNGLDDAIETGQEVIAARAFDDDRQQRKHEIRESKINDLIRKQERLLQALQKMPSSPDQDDDINSP